MEPPASEVDSLNLVNFQWNPTSEHGGPSALLPMGKYIIDISEVPTYLSRSVSDSPSYQVKQTKTLIACIIQYSDRLFFVYS